MESQNQAAEPKKAIIPIAGLGTRFLPLSKIIPKEFFPLVDKPVIQYLVEEAKLSGISHIIFVSSPGKKKVLEYFKKDPQTEKILKEKKREHLLTELKNLETLCDDLTFSIVFQRMPLGDGHAILQAQKIVGEEPCAILFADDIVDSQTPCLAQLSNIFKSCQKPVIALYRLPKEKLPAYGVVSVEKIANRHYKIKNIIEKPSIEEAPSDLAIVGKSILTPEVFFYLKKAEPSKRGEIVLSEVFAQMINDGKIIYGYEFEGKWLECGDKNSWFKSSLYLALKDPRFSEAIKEYLSKKNN